MEIFLVIVVVLLIVWGAGSHQGGKAARRRTRQPVPPDLARPLTRAPRLPQPDGDIEGRGDFDYEIVGESFYQAALETIAGPRTEEGVVHSCIALLLCDDDHPRDPKAVTVIIEGYVVGHLSREDARSYRDRLKRAGHTRMPVLRCDAIIVGGWDRGGGDRGHFGVKLDLPRRGGLPKAA